MKAAGARFDRFVGSRGNGVVARMSAAALAAGALLTAAMTGIATILAAAVAAFVARTLAAAGPPGDARHDQRGRFAGARRPDLQKGVYNGVVPMHPVRDAIDVTRADVELERELPSR